MSAIKVTTQAQLDKALANLAPGDYVACLGGTPYSPLVVRGSSHVEAWGSSHVEARGSSHVEASGSSHVVAWGSSHVEARGSSHVVAWESSHVVARGSSHVVARESSHVEARESSHVVASKYVAVQRHSTNAKVNGGVLIDVPNPSTLDPTAWCDYYGVRVSRGYALLYKALDADWSTRNARARGIVYTVGSKVDAADWDPVQACGNGLHASPSPAMARWYNDTASRYVQVKAKLTDIVVIDDKVKVPALTVVAEVDIHADQVAA